jgi:hypothetical protein
VQGPLLIRVESVVAGSRQPAAGSPHTAHAVTFPLSRVIGPSASERRARIQIMTPGAGGGLSPVGQGR